MEPQVFVQADPPSPARLPACCSARISRACTLQTKLAKSDNKVASKQRC